MHMCVLIAITVMGVHSYLIITQGRVHAQVYIHADY